MKLKTEIFSGLTVAIALVPEAVAFALIAGLHPLVGLYAAFIICLITSLLGGMQGMISGATGALAVVMVSLVTTHGAQYVFAAVILMGIIQIFFGILKIGRLVRIVPYPVMLGFVNGLAIVIFLAQLKQFQVEGVWMSGKQLYSMLFLVLFTMLIMFTLPKVSKSIPAGLVAILSTTFVVIFFNIDTLFIGDIASISGGLPSFAIPSVPFNFETLKIIFPYSLVFAIVGLLESLLTFQMVSEITQKSGSTTKETFSQGIANIVTGFFGGMGGCVMIGQTMININSGARSRISGIVAALSLISFIVFASSYIEMIPIAALTGLMMMVVIGTFAWSSLKILHKVPIEDAVVIVIVSLTTVFTDLAIAVGVGIIISALSYAWKSSKNIHAKIDYVDDCIIYTIYGNLFFANAKTFKEIFKPKKNEKNVIIDFANCRVFDHSGIEAIDSLVESYEKYNKSINLKHLSSDCKKILTKASKYISSSEEDPKYGLVVSYNK